MLSVSETISEPAKTQRNAPYVKPDRYKLAICVPKMNKE